MSKQAIYVLSDGGSLRTRQEARRIVIFALNRFGDYTPENLLITAGNTEACQRPLWLKDEKQLVKVQLCLN